MAFLSLLKIYLLSLVVFLAVDFAWLGFIARKFYASQIGHLLKPQVNWIAAFTFYCLFVAGLVYFVLLPAYESKSYSLLVFRAGFFGFVTYATYDLTNLATLDSWPVVVSIVDMIWGAVLAIIVSLVVYALLPKLV